MSIQRNIKFTQHALERAKERGLWSYVDKKKFYYEAKHKFIGQAQLESCIYVYTQKGNMTLITTMYRV